jgi:putative glutamine amidotransferase
MERAGLTGSPTPLSGTAPATLGPPAIKTGGPRPGRPPLRIGLSVRIFHAERARAFDFHGTTLQYLETSVAHWIMDHGAPLFMVPTLVEGSALKRASISIRDYVNALDGMVLQGGADVSPESYGEEPWRAEWGGNRIWDSHEIELLLEFVFQQKPVLGTCRGTQLINVAFNGSLHRDIAEEVPGAISHVERDLYCNLHHDVGFEKDSRLARIYGEGACPRINGIHHPALKRLDKGLSVEARSPDNGVVEAIRWRGSSYVMGVQWHPEFHERDADRLVNSGPILMDFLDHAR